MLVSQTLTPVQWSILREAQRKRRSQDRFDQMERHLEELITRVTDLEECCPICFDLLAGDARESAAVELPCSHHFHKICMVKWLSTGTSMKCPLCNQKLEMTGDRSR